MCGIAGFISFNENLSKRNEESREIVRQMGATLSHRGPDASGEWVGDNAAFSHTRLAVIDPEGGRQPMSRTVCGYDFVITYNGELYNTDELREKLRAHGYTFTTHSDTEVLLMMYVHYGEECVKYLNGIFAFCIWDSMRRQAFLARDRFGVKPLFFAECDGAFVFGSEIKAVLEYPNIEPRVGVDGLAEIFAISPARFAGFGVFEGVYELCPAECAVVTPAGLHRREYWRLESRPHTDSYDDTVEHVRELFTAAVKRQLVSDVPLAAFLSGGLDSSAIAAVGALELGGMATYSFDYKDNDKYFKPSAFQPDSDAYWVRRMTEEFPLEHTYLECSNSDLCDLLADAVRYKDLPGMADVDASLLYYCREVKKRHTVVLSGECSDEIFGGYPWFRDKRAFERAAFPWCYDLSMRNDILIDEVRDTLNLEQYSCRRYDELVATTPRCEYDTAEEARRREISWLNIRSFMTNLLDRKDRMSMASGLEVRVPFCDQALVEYVWNIPWEMKNRDNVSKNILREALKGILPEDVRLRRKSPYPKTHDPHYEAKAREMLREVVEDPSARITALVDKRKLEQMLSGEFDYGKPFFGQLMAGPQFIGFLLQVEFWLREYRPRFV